MPKGLIIHVSVGEEGRTEYFREDFVRIGATEICELQLHGSKVNRESVWLSLERGGDGYRLIGYDDSIPFQVNGGRLQRFVSISDGDVIKIDGTDIVFSFFSLTSESSLITTNRESHQPQFIEEAAIDSMDSVQRDDAKAFLREFTRELYREVRWSTKLLALLLFMTVFGGLFYLGYGFYTEVRQNREQVAAQSKSIDDLKEQIQKTNQQLGILNKSNEDVSRIVSLAPNLRVEYGNGVCLIVGIYDLVDGKTSKQLRYPDPNAMREETGGGEMSEDGIFEVPDSQGLTTTGNGVPVRYDFIGTGFHVGNGFILTNRHVLQPWTEDDLVKQLILESGGKARIRRLVVYFPNQTKPVDLSVKRVSFDQDIAVATISDSEVIANLPVLPVETGSDSKAIGKAVVTMGYPNGPDRLLTMIDESEAKVVNSRYGGSRQKLINYLARSGKILPLTTRGSVTDLDPRRIVHDAETAEGGSGAPLFGQSGKVIGVNFGVFTQNSASNLAVPIEFAVTLLKEVGWSESATPVKDSPASSPNRTAIANK